MADWRDDVAIRLVLLCKGEGHTFFDRDDVLGVLDLAAKKDRRKKKDKREGYSYVLTQYKDSGLTSFLNRVEKAWNKPRVPKMSLQSEIPTTEGSAHDLECVISLELDKDTYSPQGIHDTLKEFLIKHINPPFSCLVVQTAHVHARWYDIHIRYSCNLVDAYGLLLTIPWVKDAAVKPLHDFDRYTLAMIK